jgi:hypothetical protein
MNPLTEAQDKMLKALEDYCNQHRTEAWVGNSSDLDPIGGQALLYELEQLGAVSVNRIGEKWIIVPTPENLVPD